MSWRWLPATLMLGCSVDPDVVALLPKDQGTTQTDAGLPSEAGEKDAAALSRCPANTQQLLLLDGSGTLSQLAADTLEFTQLDTPECMRDGVLAAAIAQNGFIWTSATDRTLSMAAKDSSCSVVELKASVTAMAFVYEPSTGVETLYVIDGGSLSRLDQSELVELGPLSASYLVGSDYGELLAVSDLGNALYTIDVVDLLTAKTTTRYRVEQPQLDKLSGAAFWRGSLVLMFDAVLYRYDVETDSLSPFTKSTTSFTNLISSECATGVK